MSVCFLISLQLATVSNHNWLRCWAILKGQELNVHVQRTYTYNTREPTPSISSTTSRPSTTLPKTTCFPSSLEIKTASSKDKISLQYCWDANVQLLKLPRGLGSADEKLRSVCVGPRIGHAQSAFRGVLQLEVLVSKLFTVDGFASSTISTGEITALGSKGVIIDAITRTLQITWHIKPGIMRWNFDPLKPNPFSPVQRARKFSVVRLTINYTSRIGNCTVCCMLKSYYTMERWALFRVSRGQCVARGEAHERQGKSCCCNILLRTYPKQLCDELGRRKFWGEWVTRNKRSLKTARSR